MTVNMEKLQERAAKANAELSEAQQKIAAEEERQRQVYLARLEEHDRREVEAFDQEEWANREQGAYRALVAAVQASPLAKALADYVSLYVVRRTVTNEVANRAEALGIPKRIHTPAYRDYPNIADLLLQAAISLGEELAQQELEQRAAQREAYASGGDDA